MNPPRHLRLVGDAEAEPRRPWQWIADPLIVPMAVAFLLASYCAIVRFGFGEWWSAVFGIVFFRFLLFVRGFHHRELIRRWEVRVLYVFAMFLFCDGLITTIKFHH